MPGLPITVLHGQPEGGLEAEKPTQPNVPCLYFARDTGRLWAYDGEDWWYHQFSTSSSSSSSLSSSSSSE